MWKKVKLINKMSPDYYNAIHIAAAAAGIHSQNVRHKFAPLMKLQHSKFGIEVGR